MRYSLSVPRRPVRLRGLLPLLALLYATGWLLALSGCWLLKLLLP